MDLELTSLAQAETGPIDYAMRPLMARGSCLFVVGKGFSGKSTWISEIAQARAVHGMRENKFPDIPPDLWPNGLCAGGTAQWEYSRGHTLIVDGENTSRIWRRMCEKTLASYDINPQNPIAQAILRMIYHAGSAKYGLNRSSNRRLAQEALIGAAEYNGVGCIIIDPLWKVYAPTDNGDTQWINDGISYLRDLCQEREIELICVTHPAKAGDKNSEAAEQPFGSSQQSGMYDGHVYLKRVDGHGIMKAWKVRASDWMIPGKSKVKLEYGPYGGGYRPTKEPWPLTEPPDGIFLTKAAFDLLRSLPRDLFRLDQVNNCTLKTARKYIEGELCPAKMVEHAHGEGLKGDPKLYKVTEAGHEHISFKKTVAERPQKD